MKKVNVEMKRNELNAIAKELEIKFVGIKTADLVQAINNKIDAMAPKKEEKVKPTLEGAGFKEGEYVTIDGTNLSGRSKNLNGRMAMVNNISGKGFIKVTLVNPKNGQLQGCSIPMPIEALTKVPTTIMVVA